MMRADCVVALIGVAISLIAGSAAAQVTIGGTASDAEPTGIMSMFAGDRFENFRHIERFVPVAEIPANANPRPIPLALRDLQFTGMILDQPTDLEAFLARTSTSAFIVLKDGVLIYERYREGDTATSKHISFSMAKSFVSAMIGIALAEGHIRSVQDPIRKYLPELTSQTFDGVTIAHVLEMASGVKFDERYTDPDSDINQMGPIADKVGYLAYINTLDREHEPGTYNHYASINTQLLGILLGRVTGQSLTDYTIKKLWRPIGMEHDGQWVLDGQGVELAMGGLTATARDYARLGQVFLEGGKAGDTQVVPAAWVTTSTTPDAPHLLPGDNARSSNTSGYKFQWWTPREPDDDFLARGIWGQNIYVHRGNRVVIVKLSADQSNFDARLKLDYIDYLQDLAQSLDN